MTAARRSAVGAVWAGAWAAAGVPWALRGDALAALLADRDGHASARTPVPPADVARRAALAAAVALRLLSPLSRLPGGRWRNSCLFRAAAECRAMRAAGLPAVLRIGVASQPAAASHTVPVAAHAWVECAGMACRTARGGERGAWAVLRPAG